MVLCGETNVINSSTLIEVVAIETFIYYTIIYIAFSATVAMDNRVTFYWFLYT